MSWTRRISSAVFTAILVTAHVPALSSQDALSGWKAAGNTPALALTAVVETQFRTTFTLRNISGKTISAAAISFRGRGEAVTNRYEDWFGDETGGLPTGDSFDLDIGSEEAALYGRNLVISAVVFEDGVGEGAKHQLDFIRFGRFGKMLETERIKNVLSGPSAQFNGTDGITALSARVGRPPRDQGEAIADAERAHPSEVLLLELRQSSEGIRQSFFLSIQNTRIDMQRKIEKMKQMPASSKDPKALTQAIYLSELLQYYESKSNIYRSLWERTRRGKHHE